MGILCEILPERHIGLSAHPKGWVQPWLKNYLAQARR
jgi:hypothetical protein